MIGSRWQRAVVGVAMVALLAACGDDGDSSSTQTTVPETTTTTLSQIALDKAKSQRTVLVAADLPGFTVDPPDTSSTSSDLDAAANACVNNNPVLVRLGAADDPRGVSGEDFSKGETQTVSSSATFAESDDQARSAIADVSAPAFAGCFSQAIATEIRKDPTFTNVTVSTTKLPALTVGEQSVGYRSVMRARVSGTSLTFNIDFTFIRVGRAVTVLEDLAVGTAFPEAERVRLATALAQRMAAP